MFTNLGYVSTKALRGALVVALGATLAALTAVALVATSGTAMGQQGTAPTQPLYKVQDLGTLGGTADSEANAINDAGKVVGFSNTSSGETHAFLYSGGQMIDLGTIGGTFSFASDINNSDEVVGQSGTRPNNDSHAFLYSDGVMRDLNDLIPKNSSWELRNARAINDKGYIVGYGTKGDQEERRALLLVPSQKP